VVVTPAIIASSVGVLREFRASIDADAGRTSEQIARKLRVLSSRSAPDAGGSTLET
jgi:hypothetical protein